MSEQARLSYQSLAPRSTQALLVFSGAAAPQLDRRLHELVNLRVSQINGCAFCIDMHSAALLKLGVEPRALNVLAGWREAHRFFSERERAALAWAEAVNALPHTPVTDEVFQEAHRVLGDQDLAELTFAIGAIRTWNMLNVSFQTPVPPEPYSAE